MITTAVQQAPQMVEVQGAPPPAQGSNDEFRATFTARVNAPAAGDPESLPQTGTSSGVAAGTPGGALAKVATAGGASVNGSTFGTAVSQSVTDLRSSVDVKVGDLSSTDFVSTNLGDGFTDSGAAVPSGNEVGLCSLPIAPKQTKDAGAVNVVDADLKRSLATAGHSLPTKSVGSASVAESSGLRSRKGDSLASNKSSGSDTTGVAAQTVTSVQDASLIQSASLAQGASLLSDATALANPSNTSAKPPLDSVTLAKTSPQSTGKVAVAQPGTLKARLSEDVSNPLGTLQDGSFHAIVNRDSAVAQSASVAGGEDASEGLDAGARNSAEGAVGALQATASLIQPASATAALNKNQSDLRSPQLVPSQAGFATASSAGTTLGTATESQSTTTQSAIGVSLPGSSVTLLKDNPATSVQQAGGNGIPQTQTASVLRSAGQRVTSKGDGPASVAASKTDEAPVAGITSLAGADSQATQATPSARGEGADVQPLRDAREDSAVRGPIPGGGSAATIKSEKAKLSAVVPEDGAPTPSTPLSLGNSASGLDSNSSIVPASGALSVSAGSSAVVATAQAITPAISNNASHAVSASTGTTEAPHRLSDSLAGPAFEQAGISEQTSASSQIGDTHRTLLATPTTLEVGVQSGTQGWLRIRAEVGVQGEVNASLAATTSGAREILHSQMPALNAFLHSEQMTVMTTVADRGTFAGGQGQGTTLNAGGAETHGRSGSSSSFLSQDGAQSNGGQRGSQQTGIVSSVTDTLSSYDARGGVSDARGLASGRTDSSAESGRWLNVRV